MMYNFACVCYGTKYPVEYVQKLYNMVSRNTTHLINFYVFTDHVKMNKMLDGGRLYVKWYFWLPYCRVFVHTLQDIFDHNKHKQNYTSYH